MNHNKKIKLEESWKNILINEFNKDYMRHLAEFLRNEKRKKKIIYPPSNKIFNALNLTKFNDVKVVILGQDPYHGHGQANGLSFSVKHGVKLPPSLKNIFKELESDLGIKRNFNGNLDEWCSQGVLLLNSILTVEKGKPSSHANLGWEKFTDKILINLNLNRKNIVYILWGRKAQEKASFIDKTNNLTIESAHPSPYSANNGFFGSHPFSKTNKYLMSKKIKPINWDVCK